MLGEFIGDFGDEVSFRGMVGHDVVKLFEREWEMEISVGGCDEQEFCACFYYLGAEGLNVKFLNGFEQVRHQIFQ